MWLSTKSKYGLKAIYEIGIHYGDKPVSLHTISTKYYISLNYLEQIIALLKKDRLIVSTRGANGGYSLSRPPESITVGDIIRALEGSFAPSECIENNEHCGDAYGCISRSVFEKINLGISQVVDNFTLKDMIEEKK